MAYTNYQMEPTQPADSKVFEELKANPRNPRTISKTDFEALKKSIQEFGDLSAVIYNISSGQLVGGHQRVSALKALVGEKKITYSHRHYNEPDAQGEVARGYIQIGDTKLPYRETAWSIERETAAGIAANRIQGTFDKDLLAELTYELSQLENGDALLALTGQTEDEINSLIGDVSGDAPNSPDQLGSLSFKLDPAQAEVVRSALFKSRQTNNLDVESSNVDAEALYLICRDYIDDPVSVPEQAPMPEPVQ